MTESSTACDRMRRFLLSVMVLSVLLHNSTVAQVARGPAALFGVSKVSASKHTADHETVIASDNFNRADESPFTVGVNWGRAVAGNYDGFSNLVNNQVSSAYKEGIYYWQGAGSFDSTKQFARGTVVQKDGEIGLVLLGGPDQAILVSWGPPGEGHTLYIYWYAGGEDQGRLATVSSTLADGDIIEAVLEGGMIIAKVNGVPVTSVANTTSLTSGTPGFITYLDPDLSEEVGLFDDWEAGTPAAFTISGTITQGGAGLEGVQVTASGAVSATATSGTDGGYTITDVPSGSAGIVLTPALAGHTMSPVTRTVDGPVTGDVFGEDFTSTLNNNNTLSVSAAHGSVTKHPDQPSYGYGVEVTLTPVADVGYYFLCWSGNIPAGHQRDNPLHVTMDQDRALTAIFENGAVIASDDFNRADESPFVVGGNWQQPFEGGPASLIGNEIVSAPGECVYYWQGAGAFDNARQFARERVVQASGEIGLVLLGASGQALALAWNQGTLYIYWYADGMNQGILATAPSTLQVGDVIEADLDGGVVSAKVNGTIIASVENTTTLSSGTPGFETYLNGGILDDWEAGTPGTQDPLPVQLGSFTGSVLHDGSVLLHWMTLSEVNNYGFFVGRKRVNDAVYDELPNVFVAGSGTTNETHTYTFTDCAPGTGSWIYRLKQVDLDGTVHFPRSIRIDLKKTDIAEAVPADVSISQNFPNPFNPVTTIRYGLPRTSAVMLSVFNTLGQQVAVLVQREEEAGYHEVRFDASGFSSGVYLYRLTAGSTVQTRKLMLVR